MSILHVVKNGYRRFAPKPVTGLVASLRQQLARAPIDDVVLADYRMAADPNPRPRLNLVMPRLAAGADFGGVATGIDIFLDLIRRIRIQRDTDVRLIVTDVTQETDVTIFHARANSKLVDDAETLLAGSSSQDIGTRRDDLFITYNWWTTLNVQKIVDAQAAHFARAPLPLTYLIQDYEPAFVAFSSAHMLSREAYDTPPRLWGVFNSSNLHDYFRLVGHETQRAFVFEPVIADSLRPFLDAVPTSRREKRIVVYGRPGIARNCFPAIVRGLRRWAADYPQLAGWDVVSAGTAHKPVALGDGRTMASVGKLSLEDYAQLMLTSSVGLSLMASPHPSYPPLEMAHMGLRTITNTYACKDLSGFHPNIVSIGSMAEGPLAAAIAGACADAAAPVSDYRNETYVRAEKYPFMDDLARSLLAALGD